MPDREKVMSWLEGLAQPDWHKFHSDTEVQVIAVSALALLKEQEHKDRMFHALEEDWKKLKEQEAVEPKNGHWIYKKYDDMFMCSSCGEYSIRNDYPYCHWCGAKMKQEGR